MVGVRRAGDDAGMDERAPLPAADRTPSRWSISQPWGLGALTVVAASPVCVVAGTAVGLAVFKVGSAAEDCGARDPAIWCGMASALAGYGAGLVTAAATNLGVAGALIRRFRPAGQRLQPLAAHVAGSLVLVFVLTRLSQTVL